MPNRADQRPDKVLEDVSGVAGIYAAVAPHYLALGIAALPVMLGTKACKVPGWQDLDPVGQPGRFADLIKRHSHFGIGLRMGSQFPDGSALAAIDIDHDAYVEPVQFILGGLVSGRIGQRGMAIFVRLTGKPPRKSINTPKGLHSADLLFKRELCVIPPTIHPDTGQPYRWIGKPLHEVNFSDLPLIES